MRPPYRSPGRSIRVDVDATDLSRLAPASLAGRSVLERWHLPKHFLGSAGQNKLSIGQLELVDRDGDVTLVKTQKAAGTHDPVGHHLVGRDDDIIDGANPFLLVAVNGLPDDLPLGAPTLHHVAQLGDGHAERRRACHLSRRRERADEQNGAGEWNENSALHDRLLFAMIRSFHPEAGSAGRKLSLGLVLDIEREAIRSRAKAPRPAKIDYRLLIPGRAVWRHKANHSVGSCT